MLSWSSARSSVPTPDRDRKLVLYKYDTCGYCGRVFRKLDALGMESEVELRDIWEDPQARKELADVTGRTTVPCLFIDGVPLHESLDIVAWLDAYAKRPRAPSDPA